MDGYVSILSVVFFAFLQKVRQNHSIVASTSQLEHRDYNCCGAQRAGQLA
jgi:hypothetical protein